MNSAVQVLFIVGLVPNNTNDTTLDMSNYLPTLFMLYADAYGKYADYLNEWQQVIEDGPEYPIHVVYYEDLKKDGIHEINRLAKFLEIELDDQLKGDIIDMCGFDKMSKEKFPPKTEKILNNGFNFFRKGKVGDWKNWFTVSQDKLFEATWNKDIRKDTIFKFKYV